MVQEGVSTPTLDPQLRWVETIYHDVAAVLRDPRNTSSSSNILKRDPPPAGQGVPDLAVAGSRQDNPDDGVCWVRELRTYASSGDGPSHVDARYVADLAARYLKHAPGTPVGVLCGSLLEATYLVDCSVAVRLAWFYRYVISVQVAFNEYRRMRLVDVFQSGQRPARLDAAASFLGTPRERLYDNAPDDLAEELRLLAADIFKTSELLRNTVSRMSFMPHDESLDSIPCDDVANGLKILRSIAEGCRVRVHVNATTARIIRDVCRANPWLMNGVL